MKAYYGFSLIKRYLFIIVSGFLVISCAPTKNTLDHPTTQATLWVQNAAEYDALSRQVYQAALTRLALAIEDSYWTAALEQGNDFRTLPPAIIMDVDETVLDNSAFQARMIHQGKSYNIDDWNNWVREAKAEPVPGALEFAEAAAERNVTVFYLTNREASVEAATRRNLKQLGFPLDEQKDVILTKNERDDWTSDKVNRREFLSNSYRILMLFGDDLNDFLPAKDISMQQRNELVGKHQGKWGRQWFILPNPIYGSWEQALIDFNNALTDKQIEEIKKAKLDTKN